MAEIKRHANATWKGDLKQGKGRFTLGSGLLNDAPYNFRTRFEDEPGTNPEELIASAHAACFSMALSGALTDKGSPPDQIDTKATITMSPKPEGGFKISGMLLHVRASVPGMDAETFKVIIKEADAGCPVSNLLREGLKIEFDAALV